jgi:CubicO group peptidase (beta-lactamase class C family)
MTDTLLSAEHSGALTAAVQPYVDRHELAGAVMLVANKDRVLALETVGSADLETGTPMRPDALFWIASMSKPITATACMMLVDEGLVALEAPVAEYLPEFQDLWLIVEQDAEHQLLRRPARPITVRDLLSHTSGLPFSSPVEQPTLDGIPLRQGAYSYAAMPLLFAPGSRYEYSNAGINTVGRIMEVVSGMPYETCLDERLLHPLGMKDTTFWPNEEQLTRLATGYGPGPEGVGFAPWTVSQLTYPLNDRRRQPMPAGGLFSTATDCAVFCQMVLNGGVHAGTRYLSEAAVAQMTTRHTDPSWEMGYGFGWAVGDGCFGHGGAWATSMDLCPQRGLITVWMVQAVGYPGEGAQSFPDFKQRAEELFGS